MTTLELIKDIKQRRLGYYEKVFHDINNLLCKFFTQKEEPSIYFTHKRKVIMEYYFDEYFNKGCLYIHPKFVNYEENIDLKQFVINSIRNILTSKINFKIKHFDYSSTLNNGIVLCPTDFERIQISNWLKLDTWDDLEKFRFSNKYKKKYYTL